MSTMHTVTVTFENGRELEAPDFHSNPAGAHFLVVRDARGEQLLHTTFEQWETDPVGEMGRIAEALCTQTVEDDEYGTERVAVSTHSGEELRFDGQATDSDYVRLVDPSEDEELVYWVCDEWVEDPELVLGAHVGALLSGGRL